VTVTPGRTPWDAEASPHLVGVRAAVPQPPRPAGRLCGICGHVLSRWNRSLVCNACIETTRARAPRTDRGGHL
jgi:hypothetical protein